MHRPRYLGDEAWTEAWSISWYAVRKHDVVWVQHSGGLPGFITSACFQRGGDRVGAIALLNGIGDADELSMALGAIALEAASSAVEPAAPPAPTPEAYRELLGLYGGAHDEALLFRLEWRDGVFTFFQPDRPEWRPTTRARRRLGPVHRRARGQGVRRAGRVPPARRRPRRR